MRKKGNGEGTVYKTKNGSYRGQVTVGYNDNGALKRMSFSGKTKTEVLEKMRAIQNKMATGMVISPDEVTVCDLADQLIKLDRKTNYIKDSTECRRRETLKKIAKCDYLYYTPIQQLDPIRVNEFLMTMTNYSQSYIDKVYQTLQSVMKEAVKRRIIEDNPIKDLRKPHTAQVQQKVRALTKEEQKRLYDILVSKDIPYAHQMLMSMVFGMRMGEVNAMTVDDVDLPNRRIRIDKTIAHGKKGEAFLSPSAKTSAGNRTLIIPDIAVSLIQEVLKNHSGNELLFTQNGKMVTTNQVNMQFKRTIEKYHILDTKIKGKVSVHSLRHTYATRCIEAGMEAIVLQRILGHSNVSITLDTYCDAFDELKNKNLDKFEAALTDMGIDLRRIKSSNPQA